MEGYSPEMGSYTPSTMLLQNFIDICTYLFFCCELLSTVITDYLLFTTNLKEHVLTTCFQAAILICVVSSQLTGTLHVKFLVILFASHNVSSFYNQSICPSSSNSSSCRMRGVNRPIPRRDSGAVVVQSSDIAARICWGHRNPPRRAPGRMRSDDLFQ